MNNLIGILIATLYFLGFYICDYFYPEGGINFIKLRISIYCVIILLAFEYKKQNLFIEKLFLAIVLNNVIALLFNNETTYSINDIFFIATFTAIQYIKSLQIIKKWLNK